MEIDVCQAGAVSERIIPKACDTAGNCDAGQAGAFIERHFSNALDAAWDRDAGQAHTKRERIVPDVGDTVWNRIGCSDFACRVLDEHGLALVEQDPSNTDIGWIICSHRYCGQSTTPSERRVPDTGDAAGNSNAGQATVKERHDSDADDAVWNRDAGQASNCERPVPDVSDAVAYRDVGQVMRQLFEGMIISDAGDTVGDRDACNIGAVIKRIVSDAGDQQVIDRAGD